MRKFVNLIDDRKELVKEIFQTEDILEEIDELSAHISNRIKHFSFLANSQNIFAHSPPAIGNTSTETSIHTSSETVQQVNHSPLNTQTQVNPSTTQVNSSTIPTVSTASSQVVTPTISNHESRLPKLQLPTFSGNPLEWLTFWDSFNVAHNSNPNVEGVQKFNCLRAQLTGDAARVIAGFPLRNTNYIQAVDLLKTRFGQPQNIISTHRQVLLNLPRPTSELSSLRQFYDFMETHVRGLTFLGKSQDSYGDLLVPIIFGKLPNELRRNLAREHSNPEWTFPQLREAIYKEIEILEAGNHIPADNTITTNPSPSFTASLLTQQHSETRKPPPPWSQTPTTPKQKKCVYCKKPHSSNNCKIITDCTKRWTVVKEEKLYFNCLGHHRSSACQSKNRCRICKGKHHTSFCTTEPAESQPLQLPPALPASPVPPLPPTPPVTPTPTPPTQPPSTQLNVTTSHQDDLSTTTALSTSNNTVTAIVTVGAQHTYCKANILFDEGAQRSFIIKI